MTTPKGGTASVPCTSYAAVIGAVLTAAREAIGASQPDVAGAASVTASTWSRVERALSALNCDQLAAVAPALGTTPGELARRADAVAATLRSRGVDVTASRESAAESIARGRVPIGRDAILAAARGPGAEGEP